jgi:hypothetical protein
MLDFNILHRNPLLLLPPTFRTRRHPKSATHTTAAHVLRLISSRTPVHLHLDEFVQVEALRALLRLY